MPWIWRAPASTAASELATRVAGIVVAMDAQPVAGDARGDHFGGDAADLGGQRAAVGVAEDDPARPGFKGGFQAGQGIAGVGAVAVEEMLGVEQRLAAFGDEMADGGSDGLAVLVESDVEGGGGLWKSWVLPTRQTAGVFAFRTAARTSSFSAERPTRRVMPKAVRVAFVAGGRRRNRCRSGWQSRASRPRYSRRRGHRGRGRSGPFGRGELDALGLLNVAQRGVEEEDVLAGAAVSTQDRISG